MMPIVSPSGGKGSSGGYDGGYSFEDSYGGGYGADNNHGHGGGNHGHSHDGGNHGHGGSGGGNHGHGGGNHGHSHGGQQCNGHHNDHPKQEDEEEEHKHVFGGIPDVIPDLQIVLPSILDKSPPMIKEQYLTIVEKFAAQEVARSEYPWSGPVPYSTVLFVIEVAKKGATDEYARLLEESGVSQRNFVDIVDTDGNTALHHAVFKKQKSFAKYLVDMGASVDAVNYNEGQTALHWACIAGEPRIVHMLVEAGADPLLKDTRGYNAMMHAAQYNDVHSVRYLIERGSPVRSVDNEGHTTVHWAAFMGHSNMVRYFVQRGVDIDARDAQGRTALHWACHKGHRAVMSALLSLKADRKVIDTTGCRAVDLAEAKKHDDMVEFLKCKDREDNRFPNMQAYNRFWVMIGVITVIAPVFLIATLPLWLAFGAIVGVGYFFKNYLMLNYWVPEFNNPFNPAVLYTSVVLWYAVYLFNIAPVTTDATISHILINPQIWFFLYFFLRLVYQDAGAVSKYHTPDSSTKVFMDSLADNSRSLPIICPTCQINRPIRSKHCPSCNQCYARFDHHCIWINNCVAAHNQTLFITLIFNYLLTIMTGLVLTLSYFSHDINAPEWSDGKFEWFKYFYMNHPVTFYFVFYGPAIGIFMGKIGLSQIIGILLNKTTYEQILENKELGFHGHSHSGAYEPPKEKEGVFTHPKYNYNSFYRGKLNNINEYLFHNQKYYHQLDIAHNMGDQV